MPKEGVFMEIDSIITFKRVLREQTVNNIDKMMLSSAINNKNIDINLSINENLRLINKEGISLEELFCYLEEFLGNKDDYLNVPLFMLLLERKKLWDLLLNAYKRDNLSEESVLVIGEHIFDYLDDNSATCNDELITFFNSLLSIKRPVNYEIFQKSFSIRPFIFANIDDIYSDNNSVNKSLLVTLISFGYINLDLLNFAIDDSFSYMELLFRELINHELYGYVRIFVSEKTISQEAAIIIKNVVNEYEVKARDNKRLENFILSINEKLDSIIREEGLNRH